MNLILHTIIMTDFEVFIHYNSF